MNFRMDGSVLQKSALFLLMMALPAVAWGQKKTSSAPKPSAPAAPHASAPSHNSAPSHSSTPSSSHSPNTGTRPGTPNTMGHNNTTTGHTPGTNTTGRPGTNNTAGRGNTNTAGRGNTNTMGKPGGNMAGGHANAAGGVHNASTGHTPPGRQVALKNGGSASIRPNGQIRSINRNGMTISHGMHGGRTVVSTRNGARVVTVGRGGYVQRTYVVRGGVSYYSRTYYYGGAYRVGVYRGYYWGGRPYYGYYPGYYYAPVYYGWAYNPWPAPVYYGWGWNASPWYGYYGPYYAPYPAYPAAYFWLTDFMVAAYLQAAYEAQENAWLQPDAADHLLLASMDPMLPPEDKAVPMSKEVKDQIADEVKAILSQEQDEAGKKSASASSGSAPSTQNAPPPAMDPKFKVFVVGSDMSLVPGDGEECALSQGDVIQRTSDTADGDGNVTVKVVASSKADCAIGKEGPLSTDDLQEMYNNFREKAKDGMGELAKKQGTGGIPKAPDTSTTQGDVPPPAPDKSAEKSLQDQQQSADQTEAQVKQEAGSGGGGSN